MARTVTEIQNQIIASKNADANLAGLNSPSQTAIWKLWTYIVALAINLFEQILDQTKLDLEVISAKAVAGHPLWWVDQIKKFQYSTNPATPQVIALVDFVPQYPTVDATMRIVTQVAVGTGAQRRVLIKVAKSVAGVLQPLDVAELAALQSYVDAIKPAGQFIDIISLYPDRIAVIATIYYNPQYVEGNVLAASIDAMNVYISNLQFDGLFQTIHLVDAIQSVAGVMDIEIDNIYARDEQTVYGGAGIVNVGRQYNPAAGYIIEEDTAGHTFSDTLTMAPQ